MGRGKQFRCPHSPLPAPHSLLFASDLRHLQNACRGTAPASKLEPRHELTISLAAYAARVDEAKPAAQLARRVSGWRRGRIASGNRQIEPVEDVEKLRPDIELHFFLDGESAAQAHVLRNLAPPAI